MLIALLGNTKYILQSEVQGGAEGAELKITRRQRD